MYQARRLGRVQEFLKQIVFGGNDGIVTTFAIVAGFAGASADGVAQIGGIAVLVFGLANLFADAVSMGLGEFLSARSKGDLYRTERAAMLDRIDGDPVRVAAALAGLFEARGLTPEDAADLGRVMGRNPGISAEMLLAYETGLSDPGGERPAANGLFTFLAFVGFGVIPLVPYFIMEPTDTALRLSVIATGLALVALGVLRWSATGEGLRRSVGEGVAVGGTCAAVAFAVGWMVGG